MPGPPPKKDARRRNARPDWVKLPATGREGDPPDFPIGRGNKGELALWAELWSTPQALAWEVLGWTRTVARYTKLVLQSEKRDAPTSLLGEVRQLEDRLGLTPMAMKRLQWEIDQAPVDDDAADAPDNVTQMDRYREQFG